MQLSVHETLVFERDLPCPLDQLWRAFESPEARARWGRPSPSAIIIYEAADFRIGGRDLLRCGSIEDPRFDVEAIYLDIRPNQRIIYAERVSEGDALLSGALHTVEMEAAPTGSKLRLTVQIAALDGADMVQGVSHGMTAALQNLTDELSD